MSLQHLPSCPVTAVSHSTGKLSQAAQFKVVSSFPILTIEIIAKICVLITVVLCACLLFIPSHDVCCSPALSCTEYRTKQTLPCAIPLVGLGLFCPTPPSPPDVHVCRHCCGAKNTKAFLPVGLNTQALHIGGEGCR